MKRLRICSGVVFATGVAAASISAAIAATDAVVVYDATQVAYGRYVIVKRIGVEDWRSAFYIPGHRDLERARAAVVNEAARLGADAVVNLKCFDQTDAIFNPAGFFCYGDAVKAKK